MKNKNKKAVFFDRDNTLIKDEGYTYKKRFKIFTWGN